MRMESNKFQYLSFPKMNNLLCAMIRIDNSTMKNTVKKYSPASLVAVMDSSFNLLTWLCMLISVSKPMYIVLTRITVDDTVEKMGPATKSLKQVLGSLPMFAQGPPPLSVQPRTFSLKSRKALAASSGASITGVFSSCGFGRGGLATGGCGGFSAGFFCCILVSYV